MFFRTHRAPWVLAAALCLSWPTGLSARAAVAAPIEPSATAGVTAAALSATLPNALVGGYWQMWNGPKVSEVTTNASGYNLLYAAFAVGSDKQGRVAFKPVFESGRALIDDIAASKATTGATWLLSIGGGADRTIRLTTTAQANTMFNSLKPIIDTYGFQGIDFDIECGSSCFKPSAGVTLANLLKNHYGNNFVIAAAPRPYEVRSSSGLYAQFALQAGAGLDLVTLQDFDFPEASDATKLAAIVDADLASMTSMGIPASKIMIGCITYSKYTAGHNTVDVYKNIFLTQKAKYPALRGVYLWELSFDKADGWGFTRTMGPVVRGTA